MTLATRFFAPISLVAPLALLACGGSSPSQPANAPAADGGTPAVKGKTYANASEAPTYPGESFGSVQIYDLDANVYLDEAALLEALDSTKLVFMGEQHETAPVQELELFMLTRLTGKHDDVTLAMEHFQHDEQPILDSYLAGEITSDQFEKTSSPWKNYAKYWKPLVEHMKGLSRPVVGLNVPEEALSQIYGAYPKGPLEVFNGWGASFKYASSIAPRPLPAWDETYKNYFKGDFDYNAHGKQMGLSEADALVYFTDLAHIRDETMAYFTSKALEAGGRVLVVAGDWHVQTGLATPDRAKRYAGGAESYALVSTTPKAKLDTFKSSTVSGRKLARFVFVYE